MVDKLSIFDLTNTHTSISAAMLGSHESAFTAFKAIPNEAMKQSCIPQKAKRGEVGVPAQMRQCSVRNTEMEGESNKENKPVHIYKGSRSTTPPLTKEKRQVKNNVRFATSAVTHDYYRDSLEKTNFGDTEGSPCSEASAASVDKIPFSGIDSFLLLVSFEGLNRRQIHWSEEVARSSLRLLSQGEFRHLTFMLKTQEKQLHMMHERDEMEHQLRTFQKELRDEKDAKAILHERLLSTEQEINVLRGQLCDARTANLFLENQLQLSDLNVKSQQQEAERLEDEKKTLEEELERVTKTSCLKALPSSTYPGVKTISSGLVRSTSVESRDSRKSLTPKKETIKPAKQSVASKPKPADRLSHSPERNSAERLAPKPQPKTPEKPWEKRLNPFEDKSERHTTPVKRRASLPGAAKDPQIPKALSSPVSKTPTRRTSAVAATVPSATRSSEPRKTRVQRWMKEVRSKTDDETDRQLAPQPGVYVGLAGVHASTAKLPSKTKDGIYI